MSDDYIEEHDPLPDQPEAEGKRVSFPRFTMTGLGVTIQADVGGTMMSFERLVDATADEGALNDELDLLMRAVHRQKAKSNVRKLMADRREAQLSISALPEKKLNYRVERAADLARLRAALAAAWQVSGKRADYRVTPQDKTRIDQHLAETEVKEAEFDRKAKEAELVIPFLDGEIAKLRRQIAGYDPLDDLEPLPLAAE